MHILLTLLHMQELYSQNKFEFKVRIGLGIRVLHMPSVKNDAS